MTLDNVICSAEGCPFPVTEENAEIDNRGRLYCNHLCAYFQLNKEGVEDYINKINPLKSKIISHTSTSQQPN